MSLEQLMTGLPCTSSPSIPTASDPQVWAQQEAPTTFSLAFCFVVLNFCLHVAKASSLITGHKDTTT